MYALATIREFKTDQFRVIVDALEDYDTDLSFDDTGEVLAKLESGEYVSFCARARVIHDSLGEIASDYLGGCIYDDFGSFEDHKQCGAETRRLRDSGSTAICGSYFSDMIKTVIDEARLEIDRINRKLPVYVRI